FRWQATQEWKTGSKSDAVDAITRARMAAHNFVLRKSGVARDLSEIGSEFALVANRNFAGGRFAFRSLISRSTLQDVLYSQSERVEWRLRDFIWRNLCRIKKNRDRRVSRCQLD